MSMQEEFMESVCKLKDARIAELEAENKERSAMIVKLEAENARRQESIDELSSDFTKMHKRYKDDRAKLAASEKLVGELATALRDLRMAFEENDWRHIQESLNRTAAVLSKVTP